MGLLQLGSSHKTKLDIKVLRRNDISLLILDERWNVLFETTPKTSGIEKLEQKLKELLKEESRLFAEQKEHALLKKKYMGKIMSLTNEVFEKKDVSAKKEMQACEAEIKRINDRAVAIDTNLDNMPKRIKDVNLELLEETVNVVYYKIRAASKRVGELNRLIEVKTKMIEEAREDMKKYFDEKELLSTDNSETYTYFHDLLGAEELEKLDKKFFKKKRGRK